MENLKSFFFFLFRPSFWIMNDDFCPAWNNRIVQLLSGNIERIDRHTVVIDGTEVWIANYPYAYAAPYPYLDARPSRINILRMREKISTHIYNERLKRYK